MSDLTERLRRCPHSPLSDPGDDLWNGRVCVQSECVREREAADEIERLQGLIDRHDAIREVGGCPSPIEFYALEDKTNE